MSGLSVAGIASGIDSDSIISQMVALETRSIANLQRRIALEEAERVTLKISMAACRVFNQRRRCSHQTLSLPLSALSLQRQTS